MKKWIWLVALLSLIGTAALLPLLPESVPMHYDLAGNVDRWGSKYENLIFPILILLIALILTLLINYYEKKARDRDKVAHASTATTSQSGTTNEKARAEALSNAKVLGIVGLATVLLFFVMQAFILFGAYTGAKAGATTATIDIGKVSCICLGVLLVIAGNFMPKTRTNGVLGVRCSWSMYNETTWKKSNRFGGFALLLSGLLTILTALLAPNSLWALLAMLCYLLLALLLTLLYAHNIYVKEEFPNGDR